MRRFVAGGLLLAAVFAGTSCHFRRGASRSSAVIAPPAEPPWFEDRTSAAGITWRLGHHGKRPLTILETMGTGCAVLDYDDDGWDDLFLVGQDGVGNTGRCALYRNRGDGSFADVTAGSGLDLPGYYMGCGTADINNDGASDIFVSGYGVNRLFRNVGNGRFADDARRAGLQARSPSEWNSAVAFGDYDRDGWVDLYVGKYVVFNSGTLQFCNYGGIQSSCGPKFYDPQTGVLYRNNRDGTFKAVTRAAGLGDQHGKTLGAIFADFDGDGRPDLYLGNDEMAGDLYHNLGDRFRNEGTLSGTAYDASGEMQGAMGVDFADYNGDGRPDLVVSTFEKEALSLYVNRGGSTFENLGAAAGLDTTTRPLVKFGTRFGDFDNDGWLDLAITSGHIRDNEAQVDRFGTYAQPMNLFMNQNGQLFIDRATQAGPGLTTPAVGRGLATGDFDNDGRLDLLVVDLEGAPRLLMNRIRATGAWIGFRLRGRTSNRSALGARVTVAAGGRKLLRECRTSGSYFSADSPRLHFGLGKATAPVSATIRWPSGKEMRLGNLSLNRYHTVDEERGLVDRPPGG